MTRVRFYTQVAEPVSLIAELTAKALAQQHQVTVYAKDQTHAETISDYLWQQTAFIPHALIDKGITPTIQARTPVHLAWQADHIQQDDILLNCQTEQPLFFGQFKHVFEIVSTEDHAVSAGRHRYAFYRDRGYPIKHINHSEHIVSMASSQSQGEENEHT
jgi:DNA polymerase III subunit chi